MPMRLIRLAIRPVTLEITTILLRLVEFLIVQLHILEQKARLQVAAFLTTICHHILLSICGKELVDIFSYIYFTKDNISPLYFLDEIPTNVDLTYKKFKKIR